MLIFIGETSGDNNFNHPFHLHGHNFWVLETGLLPANPSQREPFVNQLGLRMRRDDINLQAKAMRDTITVPARGYTLLRFIADNPGNILDCSK